jgi:hypothetical protein
MNQGAPMKNPTIETGASRLAGLAVLAFAGFGAGIALMHVLRPDYALANHMVSDYAVGPWGAVMTGAFACASIGCLALAIGLVRSRLVSGVGWLVAALFAVAAVGLTVTALYPTDVGEGPPTPTGEIHTMSLYVSESNYFNSSWQQAFWGQHYPRLLAVKSKVDRDGIFFLHHGVGSEAWSADGFTRSL